MNNAIRLIHCFGAILTGIVILVLAIGINATHGDALGATHGFIGLICGYLAGVLTVSEDDKHLVSLVLACWIATVLAVIHAIINLI